MFLFGALLSLRKSLSQIEQKLGDHQQSAEQLKRHIATNQDAIQELRAGTIGMGQKIKELSAMMKLTRDKQEELANLDPDNRLYTKASKLVEAGATVEELMQECELPRAEAELLLSLRKK